MKKYKYSELDKQAKTTALNWYQGYPHGFGRGIGDRECNKVASAMAKDMRRFIRRFGSGYGSLPTFGGVYLTARLDTFDADDVDFILCHLCDWLPDDQSGWCEHELFATFWEGMRDSEEKLNDAIITYIRLSDCEWYTDEWERWCKAGDAIVSLVNDAVGRAESAMEGLAESEIEYVWGEDYFENEYSKDMMFWNDGRPVRIWDVRK
jgi:hypothetical protein